jgi:hypothetical protein
MKLKQFFLLSIIFVSTASIALTQNIPQKISFQGRLIDAQSRKPVTAEKKFTFKIADWIETHSKVQVNNGFYSVILGSINPIPLALFNDWQANMKILVDGKEMAPDIEMVSAPYAFKAEYAKQFYGKQISLRYQNGDELGGADITSLIHPGGAKGYLVIQSSSNFLAQNNGNNLESHISFRIGSNEKSTFSWIKGSGNNPVLLMYLNPTGSLGIGGVKPEEKLDVNGNLVLRNTKNESYAGAYIHFTSHGSQHPGPMIKSSLKFAALERSQSRLILSSYWEGYKNELTLKDGRVGINTTNPAYALQVNGDIACNTLLQTSDERYKQNIQPLTNPLQKITQLKGINYDWKTDEYPEKNFSNDKQVGMIAQDVEKIIPEIVHTDDEGYKSISYDKMAAYFVEALKELKKENENLKRQLEIQQQQINRLTNSIY